MGNKSSWNLLASHPFVGSVEDFDLTGTETFLHHTSGNKLGVRVVSMNNMILGDRFIEQPQTRIHRQFDYYDDFRPNPIEVYFVKLITRP